MKNKRENSLDPERYTKKLPSSEPNERKRVYHGC